MELKMKCNHSDFCIWKSKAVFFTVCFLSKYYIFHINHQIMRSEGKIMTSGGSVTRRMLVYGHHCALWKMCMIQWKWERSKAGREVNRDPGPRLDHTRRKLPSQHWDAPVLRQQEETNTARPGMKYPTVTSRINVSGLRHPPPLERHHHHSLCHYQGRCDAGSEECERFDLGCAVAWGREGRNMKCWWQDIRKEAPGMVFWHFKRETSLKVAA